MFSVHGNNLTLKGLYADGLKIDRRLVELRPRSSLFGLACSYALLNKIDLARAAQSHGVQLPRFSLSA